MKKSFPLSQVYGWLPPGAVVLVTTAQKDNQGIRVVERHKTVTVLEPLTLMLAVAGQEA
jgi:hypothetical protein